MSRKYIFLAKIKDTNERDCVFYYDTTSFTFECDHYFAGLRVCGASYYELPSGKIVSYSY